MNLFMNLPASEAHVALSAWFCARTQPKHEHIAAANLRKRLGLEVFHPRLKIERNTRRGVVKGIEPLFPCYLFVRCAPREFESIRYVTGISSLVHFGQKVPQISDSVIEELKECFESDEPMAVEEKLLPGSEVTVV